MTKLQERLRGGMPTKVVGRMPLSGCREVDWDWQKIEAERLEAADALDTAEAKIARLKDDAARGYSIDDLRNAIENLPAPAVAEDVVERAARVICEARGLNSKTLHQIYDGEQPVDCEWSGRKFQQAWRKQVPIVKALAAANLLRTNKEPV